MLKIKPKIKSVLFFYVYPSWATTRRWKSVVGLVVGITSWRQGGSSWCGIWRKL